MSAPHNQMSPPECALGAEARQFGARSPSGASRGTRQTGRSRLIQLQNHVSWNGAEA